MDSACPLRSVNEKSGRAIRMSGAGATAETAGFDVEGLFFDTMIAAHLLSTGTREQSLKNLTFIEFGHQMTKIEELIGVGKKQISMDAVPEKDLIPYACADADFTWQLYTVFEKRLTEKKLDNVFYDVEMPLIPILEKMERVGITIDVKEITKLSKKVAHKLDNLIADIYKTAGGEFNINSPQQLKEILFSRLKIPADFLKSGKTGISTAASELQKIRKTHPIIELILTYRELNKLMTTYLEPLPRLINPNTGRIHTTYNQTGTATGRFSSTNPNLQNIPIRLEIGNEIRKSFIAAKGKVLLAADYSQIELRIAAHLANDKNMIQAFKKGADIHRETAAVINNVDEKDVDSTMRSGAKEVNFGVLFGMNAFGLSMRTGISPHEAQDFLDIYFNHYADLKEYLKKVIEEAREKGYVESMLGR
ncbi:MAG: DNA polymerase I, partial [Planctomycetes bacterium]|nr:DNA polymerase I [Planctomycetota bacterium]